jgi:hypothetical protein
MQCKSEDESAMKKKSHNGMLGALNKRKPDNAIANIGFVVAKQGCPGYHAAT